MQQYRHSQHDQKTDMINFTPIAHSVLKHRLSDIQRFIEYGESVQRDLLATLIGRACYTEYGQKYRFSSIRGYNDFQNTLPLTSYEDLKPHIMRMVRGEKNILSVNNQLSKYLIMG